MYNYLDTLFGILRWVSEDELNQHHDPLSYLQAISWALCVFQAPRTKISIPYVFSYLMGPRTEIEARRNKHMKRGSR